MHVGEPKRDGHWPSLVSAFLYFDMSFLVWVLFGALGNALSDSFDIAEPRADGGRADPRGHGPEDIFSGLLADRIGGPVAAAMAGDGVDGGPAPAGLALG